MGFLSGIVKYLLFFFNFLILACGIILITVGVIITVDEDKGIDRFTSFSIGGFAIAVGVIIFLIAFFGCCGAIKENSCMLTTYAIILILLFILQAVLGALAFVSIKNDDGVLDKDVDKVVRELFKKYNKDKETKDIIDNIQKDWECCGVKYATDWIEMIGAIPSSCCGKDAATCNPVTAYHKGCSEAFKDLVSDNIKIIGGVAIAFAVVELLGAIFACIVKNRH